jgi:tetratricopeptide (TPR) repeat protein
MTEGSSNHALVLELERALDTPRPPTERGELHLRLADVLAQDVLGKREALLHYRMAYRYDPAAQVAVEKAHAIYDEMGKLPILAQLLEIQLRAVQEPDRAVRLLRSLADVLADVGETEKARACLDRAVEIMAEGETLAALGDLECPEGWQARSVKLAETAERSSETDPEGAARLFVRAGKIARRHDPDQCETYLRRAALLCPTLGAATLPFEDHLSSEGRLDELGSFHDELCDGVRDVSARADLLYRIGTRWILRFDQPARSIRFFQSALTLRPDLEHAAACLERVNRDN